MSDLEAMYRICEVFFKNQSVSDFKCFLRNLNYL